MTVAGLRAFGHTLAAENGLPRRAVAPAAGLERTEVDCMFDTVQLNEQNCVQ